MFDNAQITAITASAQVAVGNPNRDGSGTIVDIVESKSGYGCIIQSVTVKAVEATENGIVRLFVYDPNTTQYTLLEEFFIVNAEPSGKFESFVSTLIFPKGGFFLADGWKLAASTEYEQVFNVFVNGFSWAY